jgi:hypothetical protein
MQDPGYARIRNRYLARRWVVITFAMVVGGLAGFGWAASRPDVYVAQTAVIATESDITADQVGSVAATAFSTDAVLQPVIDRLGLDATPESLLASGTLHAETVSSGPVLLISGRSSDAQRAEDLANAATDSFVEVAREKGLGTFAPFDSLGPATARSHEAGLFVLLGALAGALLAILTLATAFFLRDPVVSEDDARREFAPDAAFRLAVGPRRTSPDDDAEPEGEDPAFEVWPSVVFGSLWATVDDRAGRDGHEACAVLVAGSDADWAAQAVARRLEMRASRRGLIRRSSDGFSISSTDPRLPEFLATRDTVVAIVPSGTPRRSLRRVEEELQAFDTGFHVLVLVDPRR